MYKNLRRNLRLHCCGWGRLKIFFILFISFHLRLGRFQLHCSDEDEEIRHVQRALSLFISVHSYFVLFSMYLNKGLSLKCFYFFVYFILTLLLTSKSLPLYCSLSRVCLLGNKTTSKINVNCVITLVSNGLYLL